MNKRELNVIFVVELIIGVNENQQYLTCLCPTLIVHHNLLMENTN